MLKPHLDEVHPNSQIFVLLYYWLNTTHNSLETVHQN